MGRCSLVNASASEDSSSSKYNGITHTNSQISAQSGSVNINSASDLNVVGANILANDIKLDVAGKTTIESAVDTYTSSSKGSGWSAGLGTSLKSPGLVGSSASAGFNQSAGNTSIASVGSQLNVGGNLALKGDDLKLRGSQVTTGGGANIDIKNDIILQTAEDSYEHTSVTKKKNTALIGNNSKTTTTTTKTTTNIKSGLNILENAKIKAGGEVLVKGSEVNILGNLDLDAKNGVQIINVKDKHSVHHKVEQKLNYGVYTNNRDRETNSETWQVVGSNFNVGGEAKIKSNGDVLIKGSKVNIEGDAAIEADDITIMGAYNWSRNTEDRGDRKKGSTKIKENWNAVGSNVSVGGNLSTNITNGTTLEVIGSNLNVTGAHYGNTNIETVEMRNVEKDIYMSWDSGPLANINIGIGNLTIGNLYQDYYDFTPFGQADMLKRDYLEIANIFSGYGGTDQHTGIDHLNTNSRDKETLIPLKQNDEKDLVNFEKIDLIKCTSIECQNGAVMTGLNSTVLGLESYSRIHDKQIGTGGNDKNWIYKLNKLKCLGIKFCGDTLSIVDSFTLSMYAGVGNLLAPMKSLVTLGGKSEKNWNKVYETQTTSSIKIGGGSYVNGNISNIKPSKDVYGAYNK